MEEVVVIVVVVVVNVVAVKLLIKHRDKNHVGFLKSQVTGLATPQQQVL